MREVNEFLHDKDKERNRLSAPHNQEDAKHTPIVDQQTKGVDSLHQSKHIPVESPIMKLVEEQKKANAEGRPFHVTQEEIDRAVDKLEFPIEEAKSRGERSAIEARKEYAGLPEGQINVSSDPNYKDSPYLLAPTPHGNWKILTNACNKDVKETHKYKDEIPTASEMIIDKVKGLFSGKRQSSPQQDKGQNKSMYKVA